MVQIVSADKLSSANPESGIDNPYVRLLKKPELAVIIGKSPRSIEGLMRERVIPFIRIGRHVRFKLSAVERALEKLTVEAVPRG